MEEFCREDINPMKADVGDTIQLIADVTYTYWCLEQKQVTVIHTARN